jgi:hypothetical protein
MSSQRGAGGAGPGNQLADDLNLKSRALLISVFLLVSSVALLLQATPAQAQTAAMTVTKSASASSVENGDSVTYTVTVTNDTTGTTLNLNSLSDSEFGEILDASNSGCTSAGSAAIVNGLPYQCTFTRTITGNEGTTHSNFITASGLTLTNAGNVPVSDTSNTVNVAIEDPDTDISVDVTASPTSRVSPGGSFTYTVEVDNNGGDTVTLTALSENGTSLNGVGTCDTGVSIAADGTYTCSFSETFTGQNGDSKTTTVTATAQDPSNAADTDTETDSVTVTISATGTGNGDGNFTVTKTASPTSRVVPGGTFTFSFVVTNNSGGSVSLTTLSDNIYGNLDGRGTCDVPQTISNGNSYSCQFSVQFTGNSARTETNTVTATATPAGGGSSLSDTDTETISITGTSTPNPTLTIPFNPFNPFNPVNPFNPQNPFIPIGSTTDSGRGPIVINNNNSSSSSSSAAAAAGGGAVAAPPATPTTLVRTGFEALPMAAGGMAVLLLGFVMLAAGKRKLIYGNID